VDLNRNGRCRLIRGPMQCPPIQGPAAVAMTLRLGRGLINQIRGSLTLLLLAMVGFDWCGEQGRFEHT
jgi:hypothetical protein